MNLLQKIGAFFTGLFNAAKRTWNKIDEKVKDAILHGSSIVETINSNIKAAPEFVIGILQSKFPDLTREKLLKAVGEVSKALKIADQVEDADLETMIKNLQEYLGGLKGKVWAGVSHSLAALIAIALAPPATKFAEIAALLEYAYHAFIKKDNKQAA